MHITSFEWSYIFGVWRGRCSDRSSLDDLLYWQSDLPIDQYDLSSLEGMYSKSLVPLWLYLDWLRLIGSFYPRTFIYELPSLALISICSSLHSSYQLSSKSRKSDRVTMMRVIWMWRKDQPSWNFDLNLSLLIHLRTLNGCFDALGQLFLLDLNDSIQTYLKFCKMLMLHLSVALHVL